MGGTKHISKTKSPVVLSHISSFVKNRRHTNNVIMNEPHRHYLDAASYINNEVIKRKMYKYGEGVELDISGEYATQTAYE
jgi:hypothetical protein